jgi:hypothetical protein
MTRRTTTCGECSAEYVGTPAMHRYDCIQLLKGDADALRGVLHPLTFRFTEATAVGAIAVRLEAALRRAPKALLDERVTNEQFMERIGWIRLATDVLSREVETLAMLMSPDVASDARRIKDPHETA